MCLHGDLTDGAMSGGTQELIAWMKEEGKNEKGSYTTVKLYSLEGIF